MCDTFTILANQSAVGAAVLAKNSDRPSFDSQPLACHRRKRFVAQEKLKLAYVTIDQALERFGTIGSSPYWCWGYETGINEFGVAIGNEAIYTKDLAENADKEKQGISVPKGLLGMELLRLGLERGKTARAALGVITDLIEKYGQWGSGVPMKDTMEGSYNNAFVIADGREAYVLETAGKRWAVKRVDNGYAAISNELSIRSDYTDRSSDLIEYAIGKDWWPVEKRERFDFAAAYIERKKPRQVSHIRVQRMKQLLRDGIIREGKVSLEWMKRILRDHYEDSFLEGAFFNPADPDFLTLCMHESMASFTWGNTASSSLCVLPRSKEHIPVMWWAAGVPCCSVYIPVFPEAGRLPECLERAGTYGKTLCAPSEVRFEDTYREGSFWWEMRSLLDLVNGDKVGTCYHQRHHTVRRIFDKLENRWTEEIRTVENEAVRLKDKGWEDEASKCLYEFTEKCMREVMKAVKEVKGMLYAS